jgi:hypothetical protein
MDKAVAYAKYVAKALATGVLVVLVFLTTILTGDQALDDVTFVQWCICGVMVLSAYGIVYNIPNGPRPTAPVSRQIPPAV